MTLAAKTLRVATSQIGVQELPKGSNAGKVVESYLNSVGITKGYSWCMAFVYWCVNQAAKEKPEMNPLIKTGGVLKQWNSRPALRVSEPQPGDIFIMDYGKGLGHTGIVEKVSGNKLYTIEGNTNDDGSREGYKVCRRTRDKKDIKGYLRIS